MTTPTQPGSPWDRPAQPPRGSASPPDERPVAPPLNQPVVPSDPVGSDGPPDAGAWESSSGAERSRGTGTTGSSGSTEVAKQEAVNVKDSALSAGGDVAQTAKEQAGSVVSEAKSQAQGLLYQFRTEVDDQAGTQLSRVADSLHSFSQELGAMASKSDQDGPMTDLAKQASHKGGEIAHWLQEREPGEVLAEVKSFARRRPFAFLGLCFAAGLVAGRVTRGAVAANTSLDSGSSDQDTRRRELDWEPPAGLAPTPAATVVESAGPSRGDAGGGRVEAEVDPLARTTNAPVYDEPIR